MVAAVVTAAAVAAPSPVPAAEVSVVPVVAVGGQDGMHCLMGGIERGRFVDPATAAKRLRGGERYTLIGLTGRGGQATGTRPEPLDGACEDTPGVALSPLPAAGFPLVAVGSEAAARLEMLSETQPVYREAMAELLRQQGIAKPDVRLTQVIRTDFEGDGGDEVILTATRHAGEPDDSMSAAEGDYSLIAVRRLVGGQVQTEVIAADIRATPAAAQEAGPPMTYAVIGVVDLNGGGVADLVISERYYEGASFRAFHLSQGRFTPVLECGCGL